ncbi:MAG: hypothetical protein J4A00_08880 [Gammaproteobacteria bacterium]|nr:hypothetical protein [Gammaproteobacteria bacterium]
MTDHQLPAGFADLEPFVADWNIPKRADRFHKRVNTEYGVIKKFYDAIVTRMDAVIAHLNRYPVEEIGRLPEAESRLLNLAFSFMQISAAVECWEAPDNGALDPDKVEIIDCT